MAALMSPIVDIILRLWTGCAKHTRYLLKLQENKDLLSTAMDELKEARDDVQKRVAEAEADPNEPKMRTDPIRGWLERVQIIEGEMEVILQKANEQLSRARCLGGCCPPNNCWNTYKLGKSIAKKIPLVDVLKGKGKFEELTYKLPTPSVQDMNLESTVGMESMFDKVWRLINSRDDKPVRIMGLHGHGGVGKTTLLEKINNEFNKISEHDHVVIFVVVSKPINVQAIQTEIEKKFRLSHQGDERERAPKIFNMLRNKKFVILLDDLWGKVDLQRIGIPSPLTQCNSSKLIFTTRNEEVCGDMEATHKFQVECLPWDKAWRLFQDKVGNETLYSHHPGIPKLAELVAKECGGLPMALITIGRAMSTKKSVEEWKDAITTLRNSASEFQGTSDEVLSRLKLSYDYLCNDTIKSCFLYCALFPEDYHIHIPGLIDYWIAEGILNRSDNNLDGARSYGHHVIETLKRACLLESLVDSSWVKMHDVIRDLALWIVNDCKSSSITTSKFLVASNVCERWRNAEKIIFRNTHTEELEEPPTSPNLRTLLLQQDYFFNLSLPQSFFQFMPFLRVLDMSYTRLTELPRSICQLSDLQYLNLKSTNIKQLPIELRKLVKLKFLDLTGAWNLKKIPPGVIADLSELQVLKLAGLGSLFDWRLKEEDGDGDGGLSLGELDRLKQLQEVTLNISTSLALEDLLCNKKLRMICTRLELQRCVNLKSISLLPPSMSTTAPKGGLWNLITIQDLTIYCCVELEELILFMNDEGGETNTTTTTTTSAAAGLPISNNNKLEQLKLEYLPRLNNFVWGEKYHHYMAAAAQQQQHFQNLYSIYIGTCDALKDLTWVVYVESLKYLSVHRCKGLETIIELGDDHGLKEGASGGGCRVFRRLKKLQMSDLPNLKSICSHAMVFPSIERISIFKCPELKKLPLDSGSNINNTLQDIRGEPKWWSELQWEDEGIESKFHPYLNKGYYC